MRTISPLVLTLLAFAAALLHPGAAPAQDVQMCSDQPVPAGYVVVGTSMRGNCASTFGAPYNSLTVRMPGDTVTVCGELSQLGEGYVIAARTLRGNCPTSFGAPTNTITYRRLPWATGGAGSGDLEMCSEQPVPAGFVVVRTGMRGNCTTTFGAAYNSMVIRLPGDTVTVCSEMSRLADGYVVTRQGMRGNCPTSFGASHNTVTYQRVGPPAEPAGDETVAEGAFIPMNPYDRAVFGRLAEMETWLQVEAPTHHPWLGKTAQGTTARTTLDLEGGRRYTLIGVCDGDCTDLDLRVLDGGYLLAEDVRADEHATVDLSTARDARLTVEVVMARCAQSPCHFAVGVYETPRAGAIPPRRPPGGDVRVTPRPRP